jgi:hypothetical protein
MSKGPGHIERQLAEIFEKKPKGIFSTVELCLKVYRIRTVKKKHRVAVLRALKGIARGTMPTLWRQAPKHSRNDLWFDYRAWSKVTGSAGAMDPRPRKR